MDPTTIKPMPEGLRMIAGDSKATAAQWAGPQQIVDVDLLERNSQAMPDGEQFQPLRIRRTADRVTRHA